MVILLQTNKLSLSVKKTHFIIFRSGSKAVTNHESLYISGQIIRSVKSTKFLGIIIDKHLLWYDHINLVESEVQKCIGI